MIRDYVRTIVADAMDAEMSELKNNITNLREELKAQREKFGDQIDNLEDELTQTRDGMVDYDAVRSIIEEEVPEILDEDDVRRIVDDLLSGANVSISVR